MSFERMLVTAEMKLIAPMTKDAPTNCSKKMIKTLQIHIVIHVN